MDGLLNFIATDGELDSAVTPLRIFGAVVMVVAIGMLVTTRRLRRLQRNRAFAAMLSGGWLAIVTGFLLGPIVLNVIDRDMLLDVRPLLLVGLGWIGLIIGLQAKGVALKLVPPSLWRWTAMDALASVVIIGSVGWYFMYVRLEEASAWTVLPTLLLATCAIGWAAETRSIEPGGESRHERLATLVRAGAGLAAIIAVLIFGVGVRVIDRTAEGLRVDGVRVITGVVLVVAIAAVLAAVARDALGRVGGQRGGMLVVALGVMTLAAGLAADLFLSPLLAAMLVGIVIGNFKVPEARNFEQFVVTAEQPVAVIFYLLAGVLLDPRLGWWGWLLVLALVAARVFLKPGLMSRSLESEIEPAASSSPLFTAPIRQSPVAIPLAVGLVLAESSPLHQELLTVVVLVGLACEILPIAIGYSFRRRESRFGAAFAGSGGVGGDR